MNPDYAPTRDWKASLENLAAELTAAAYPVVLRHGVGDNWLDMQLDLWKALTETVKKLELGTLQAAAKPSRFPEPSEFYG